MIIAPQTDSACVTVEPVDDEIAEGTEFFNLTAMVNNTLDSVNGTTTIEISDNDGIYVCRLIIQIIQLWIFRCNYQSF